MRAAEDLLDLAGSVADGLPVDWERVEERTEDQETKERIRALKLVDVVRQAHLTLQLEGARADRPSSDSDGWRWGHLQVLEKIGEGAFGEVYRARDSRLDREVALKLLRLDSSSDAGDAVIHEGRLLARVDHPHVVTVYGADRRNDRVGLWMEFVEGRTLSQILREQGSFGAREATLVGIDLCRALAAVHGQGIVHRDVKAQNVMRQAGGRIKLMDFGVGRDQTEVEETGSISGTPLYLAPEVLAGEAATVATDLYSLGVLLFHLVTGNFPVRGRNVEELRRAHERGSVALLRDVRPDLPESFVAAVETALAADPLQRFSSAGQMERGLKAVLEPPTPVSVRPRPRKLVWGALVASVLALVMIAIVIARWPEDEVNLAQAFEHYSNAKALHAHGNLDSAVQELEAATRLDPRFALAYHLLTVCQHGLGDFDEALETSATAYRLKDEVGVYERSLIVARYFIERLQYQEALDEFETLVRIRTGDEYIHRQMAHLYGEVGDFDSALRSAKKSVLANPRSIVNHGLLVVLLAEASRYDEALAEVAKARTKHGHEDYFYWGEGLALLGKGEVALATEAFGALSLIDGVLGSSGQLMVAQALIYQGRLREAARFLKSGLRDDRRQQYQVNDATRMYWLARIYLLLGEEEEARAWLDRLMVWKALPVHLKNMRNAALVAVELGEIATAESLLRGIEEVGDAYPSHISRGSAAHIRAVLLWHSGDLVRSRATFEDANISWRDSSLLWSWARFDQEHGAYPEALELLEGVIAGKGQILRDEFSGMWVLAHLQRARCRTELNQNATALEDYDLFLSLWSEMGQIMGTAEEARRVRRRL